MVENKVYAAGKIDFTIDEIGEREEPRRLLMCSPEYFDIIDIKNVHMEGNTGKLNKDKARNEWDILRKVFKSQIPDILDEVLIIEGAKDCEDMVFCANQSFPWVVSPGQKIVIMSKMRHESRRREVPYFEAFYKTMEYSAIHLQKTQMFEGMGDLIPHSHKRLLYGGYGHRTNKDAYDELSAVLQAPVIALELIDERFYHLDTCFVSLGEDASMLCKEAFTREGIEALQKMYKRIHFIPVDEAVDYFSLNAHTMFNFETGKKVAVIHKGAKFTVEVLKNEGFEVIETDTTEFMKSGGSVFCMKMNVY